jgi:cobalt/nickel transport system permease protein
MLGLPASEPPAELPTWLRQAEAYRPARDRDGFLDRTLRAFLRVLALGRRRPLRARRDLRSDPTCRLACALGFVLLVSLARSPSFVAVAGAAFLAVLALQPAGRIARTLRAALPAAGLAAIVLLPYALSAGPARPALLVVKVLLSTGAVALAASSTAWAELSGAARRLGVPSLFVMVLDVTTRFVALLAEVAVELLQAVRLRSVGHNRHKGAALGGVAGSLYLRSRELAEELHAAMVCRGFTGEYRPPRRLALGLRDALLGAGLAALALALLAWPSVP